MLPSWRAGAIKCCKEIKITAPPAEWHKLCHITFYFVTLFQVKKIPRDLLRDVRVDRAVLESKSRYQVYLLLYLHNLIFRNPKSDFLSRANFFPLLCYWRCHFVFWSTEALSSVNLRRKIFAVTPHKKSPSSFLPFLLSENPKPFLKLTLVDQGHIKLLCTVGIWNPT